ncbi:hypothetical protein AMAG_03109 [Allomyces macrogynus ATCC 38327]|uniref:Protein FAF1 n=1 Tax=Allomyces macrogynus (strain ATCC 38327) TaxID=578462 RepID=A0A0L0S4E5_ALLM3|nr:hypothetical protein AMAG_03109 [Allomyces macrogynus ATCC 38327]|eukprot:KNE57387.1 hypothetical protein AMAG_03109 [Allomyces macrogynus ATCC 38327]
MDARLAAHAASFWGWSDGDDSGPEDTGSRPAPLRKGKHVVEDMRSDSEMDDDDDEEDMNEASDEELESDDDAMSDDNEESYDEPQLPVAKASSVRRTAPVVVEFDETALGGGSTKASIHEYKKFMSSKVSKITAAPAPPPAMSKKEKEREAELEEQDRELNDLIKTAKLIEEYAAEELTGRDRRKYQIHKLAELGMKPVKTTMPTPQRLALAQRDKKLEAKAMRRAKALGLDTNAVKTKLTTAQELTRNTRDTTSSRSKVDQIISFSDFGKKKVAVGPQRRAGDRGLKASIGKFKNGMLTISSTDIKRVQQSAIKKKSSGSRRK